MAQPLSYFAALREVDNIFEKGVTSVEHGGLDAYYRCLLPLDEGALRSLPVGWAAKGHAWLRSQLSLNGAEVEGDEERVGAADVAEALALPICDSIADIIAPVVRSAAEEGWSRCMVRLPPNAWFKVWFDGCTHQSGRQRGWAECGSYRCIKYKFTEVLESRVPFCAAMALWMGHGVMHSDMTRSDHLAYWPSPEQVSVAAMDVLTRDF